MNLMNREQRQQASDEDRELTEYIWWNYRHLFTDLESLAEKAIIAESKARATDSARMAELLQRRWGQQDNPEVCRALEQGVDVFHRRVRDRILSEEMSPSIGVSNVIKS